MSSIWALALLLVTSGPGSAAEPQRAPAAEEPPPLAVSTTPEQPPPGADVELAPERKRLNLWPLLYYSHNPLSGTTQFNLLGPIVRIEETPKEKSFALSPLYYRRENKKTGDAVVDFLWPYGSFTRREGEEETRLSPIFESDKDESPSFEFFPIYGGRSSKGEAYGGIFPIAGTIKERFGQDEGSFFLFPLFAKSRRDETTTSHVLWPIFSSVTGPKEEGFRAWPFFGWHNEEGRMESSFALWPIWNARRKGLDTENPENFWMLFPFFGQTTSPKRDSWVALWPFIHYAKDKEHDYTNFSLFPLLSVTRGADREGFKLLPLFGYEKTKHSQSSFLVAPFIYGTRDLEARGYKEKRTRWLFFSKDRQKTWTDKGETSRQTHVWPIVHYQRSRSGAVEVAFPSVFPLVSDQFQRNWPLLTLYDYKRDEAGRVTSSLLWNLFTYEADEHSSSVGLAFLFDYASDKSAGTESFSLLKGLFSYKHSPERSRYSFLYIPWETKGKAAEPPAATTVAAKKPEPVESVPDASSQEARRNVRQRIIFESIR
jgi:hypothetical protein